jgi:PAS domain S-box-containing protein
VLAACARAFYSGENIQVTNSADEKVKILLVDDEPRNLDALESILDTSGCTFVRALSADEALLATLQNDFAAIVLDIKMPDMDGFELARLIKQRKRSQHVPILFLTAYCLDEQEVLQAYGIGAVDFLSKPINPEILRSKVAVFASLFRTTRALASAVEALNTEVVQKEAAQDQLRLAKELLETRVLERTAELARANREVRDNEERLRLALAVAQVATWEWDLTSGKMRWSADPEVVFGFPAGAFGPDARISHAVHPDDAGALESAFQRAMETGDYETEYRAVRPDGSVVWIADRGRVVQDANSQPNRILGVSGDLTRRKVLEEALRESDRRKDEFLATLAHELRNPLAPIRYAVKVLDMKGPGTSEQRWAVELIERQTQHMARLIDDLLDINRITRNTLELRKEPVELSTVIEAAFETVRPLIERDGHKLTINIPSEKIHVNGDPVRLAQIFSNLLNNAAKYSKTERGGGNILLTAKPNGASVAISVKDDGVGIPDPMLPRVFEMFAQVSKSIDQSEGGLGIGLALARRLVEMHGGSIEAFSEGLGKGSRFTVHLPVIGSEPRRHTNVEKDIGIDGAKRRILIADDNPDVAESFEVMLQMFGHDVRTAFDGLEALEKAEEFRPDIIVLDVGMPKLDGYETARRIRQKVWGQDVVLIAVTGWGNEKDKTLSAEAGFDVHLVKPVDADTILKSLNTINRSDLGGKALRRN